MKTEGNTSIWGDTYIGLIFLYVYVFVCTGGKNLVFYFRDFLGFIQCNDCMYYEEVPYVFRTIASKPDSLDV